jgi:hypothetical protein
MLSLILQDREKRREEREKKEGRHGRMVPQVLHERNIEDRR